MELNTIYNEDCLEGMKRIPDGSVDMILCDLPYGTSAAKWDSVIPFEPLWEQYERVIKDNGAIVLTGSQPFTSALVMSNPKMFKYEWIWEKSHHSNFMLAKKQPLKFHENVCVFYKKQPTYNPIMTKGKSNHGGSGYKKGKERFREGMGIKIKDVKANKSGLKYPRSVQYFKCVDRAKSEHPTQKPVALFEYLIKTYTNEGETVLDNCMGSGTTAIAALNTGRNFIGFELDEDYHKIANDRIAEHIK